MERVTTDQLHRTLLHNIYSAQRRTMETQEQLSSGYTLNRPSDDPVRSVQVLDLLGRQNQLKQYQENVQSAVSWSRASEDALSQGAELVQRARTLLLQAANDTQSAQSRASAAAEITNMIDSIKLIANSKLGDQYLFAGDEVTTAPYIIGGGDVYQANVWFITRSVGPGQQVKINVPGSTVWGDDTSGLLQTLRSMAANLSANTPASIAALRTSDLQSLDANLETLSLARTQAGELQARLELQSQRLEDLQSSNDELLSTTRDTDFALASSQYAQRAAALTAALKTGQQIVAPSLVDFLQ